MEEKHWQHNISLYFLCGRDADVVRTQSWGHQDCVPRAVTLSCTCPGHIGVLGGAAAVLGLADVCPLLHCSESEILHHDKQYEPFYSSFVALSTHYITTVCGLSKCSSASLVAV